MPQPDDEHRLGQSITDLHDPVARANFRVVVIRPDEVERLDISDPAKARRWRYTFVPHDEGEGEGQGGKWREEELWP